MVFVVAEGRLALHVCVALLVDHKVATAIALGEDAGEEGGAASCESTMLVVGDVRRPYTDEMAETELVLHVGVP